MTTSNKSVLCPNCKLPMKPGILIYTGTSWADLNTFTARTTKFFSSAFGNKDVIAYNCSRCEKIEMYTTSHPWWGKFVILIFFSPLIFAFIMTAWAIFTNQ